MHDVFSSIAQGTVMTGDNIFYLEGKIVDDYFIAIQALDCQITIEKSIVKQL